MQFPIKNNYISGGTKKGHTLSNENMLLQWLRTRTTPFGSHDIQTSAVNYISSFYGKKVTPDTLSRLWRKMREDYRDDQYNSSLYDKGLFPVELKKPDSPQKWYKINKRG
tara:strand:- start:1510 stop:1839 length:330 start_codon:yes stop_codon:yes gene_type:complete